MEEGKTPFHKGLAAVLPQARIIPRMALYTAFDVAAHKSVVCIWAPAGYGKSVSATLWLHARGLCHAWIPLDPYDDTPWLFYRRFCDALAHLWPESDAPARALAAPGFRAAPAEHAMETALSLPRGAGAGRHVLVLDDLHLLSNAEVLASLPFVLRRLPADTTAFLLGRGGSAREMFRTAAERTGHPEAGEAPDEIAVIDPDALRFSPDETRDCLAAFGQDASDAHRRTEGWPIAVAAYAAKLATAAGRGNEGAEWVTAVGEDLLDGCIRTQMWEPLDAAAKDFLLRTCIAESLVPALCARLAMMTEGEAGAALERVAAQSLLTSAAGGRYVHHHLFRDFLRARLEEAAERGDIDQDTLLADAAAYHLETGEYYPAMHFALRSGRNETVAAALRETLRHDAANNSIAFHVNKIGAFFTGKIADEMLDTHPYLYLPLVWYHHLIGDASATVALLDRLYAALPDIFSRYPAFRAQAIILFSFDYRSEQHGLLRIVDLPFQKTAATELAPFPTLSKNLPFYHRGAGDMAGFPGMPEETETFRRAVEHVMGRNYPSLEAIAQAGILYEMNRLAQAFDCAMRAEAALPPDSAPESFLFTHLPAAAVFDAMERPDEAHARRVMLRRDLEAIGGRFLFPNLDAYEAKLRLQGGDAGAARAWLGNYFVSAVIAPGPDGKPRRLELFRIFQHLTTARALMVAGDPADARAFLERTVRLAADFRRVTDRAEALALLAILEWHRGKRDVAAPLLEEAILLVQPYRYIRVFADEGAAIMPILKRLAGRTVQPGYAGDLDPTLLNEIRLATYIRAKARLGIAAAMTGRSAKLTKRQLEVLLRLSKGLGRRETAASTGLSYENVKAHTAALYRTLGVASAADAVLRARELGLIE